MQALGDHLGADEDVGAAGLEGIEDVIMAFLAGGGVGIHACDLGAREATPHNLLDALGANAGIAEFGVAAARALLRDARPAAADMASQAAVGAVVCVGDVAARAGLNITA